VSAVTMNDGLQGMQSNAQDAEAELQRQLARKLGMRKKGKKSKVAPIRGEDPLQLKPKRCGA